jgi:hypothetical protein
VIITITICATILLLQLTGRMFAEIATRRRFELEQRAELARSTAALDRQRTERAELATALTEELAGDTNDRIVR